MPIAHWTQIQDLFLEASELPKADRERLLDRETASDPDVRRAVESLLVAGDHTGGFLTRALSLAAVTGLESAAPQPGDRFGAYASQRQLGEGGMGSVFLAYRADGAYEKQVAIKVIRAGLDTPAARVRFRAERQILAQLEHPNVARLLEGGETPDGLPYVVMEFVDGIPIDEYCRASNLDLDSRLALFRQVCDGVSCAHRNLIVHRDLKPGNILVTSAGVAKLVDFGIAKSLWSADASVTRAADRALTPNYASPEQVLGKHITPASDVYSLGVVLYELLAGKVPYDLTGAPPSRIEHVICEENPPPPSAAAGKHGSRLRSDLDNIVAKAMRKDPAMRYPSVEALSADLERYQTGFPVHAAPLSMGYRSRKFLARNRWAAIGTALFALAAAGFVGAVIRERNTANRERVKAEQVAKFLADSFRAASPQEAKGRVVTARDILDSGASRIESELSTEPDVRATLMRTIGVVYSSIAEYRRGLELVDKAIAVRARARDVQPEEFVRDAMSAGGVRFLADDWSGGIRRLEEAAKLQERLAPGNMALRGDLLSDLGRAQTLTAQFGLAERTLRQAIEARKKAGDEAKLADAYGRLAGNYGYQGKYDQAIPLELDALSVLVRLHGEFHPSVISRYNSLARGYTESGRPEEAVKYGEKAVASARKIYDPSHPDLATQLNALGMAYTLAGRWQDCLRTHEEALAIWRKDPERKANIANGLNNVAKAHLNLGDHDRYYSLTKEALAVAREVHSVSPVLVNNWAAALRQRGELDEALTNMQDALAAIVKSLPADHVTIGHLRRNLALVFIDLGRYGEAEPLLRDAAAILSKKLPPNHWMLVWNDALLAECRLAAGDLPAARKLSQDAARILEAANHPTAAAALGVLGRSHLAEATPDATQAAGFLTRALEIERQPSGFHDPFTVACAEASLSKAYRKLGRPGEADTLRISASALLAKHPSHARLRAALSE